MDLIKNWLEYFRGPAAKRTDDFKDFILKPPDNVVPGDDQRENDLFSDPKVMFFDDSFGDVQQPSWQLGDGGGIFNSRGFMNPFDMFRNISQIMRKMESEFESMQGFGFENSIFDHTQGSEEFMSPMKGESLRDHYLKQPDSESPQGQSAWNSGGRDIEMTLEEPRKLLRRDEMPQIISHRFEQGISIRVGPDGIAEITKVINNGNEQQKITKRIKL